MLKEGRKERGKGKPISRCREALDEEEPKREDEEKRLQVHLPIKIYRKRERETRLQKQIMSVIYM